MPAYRPSTRQEASTVGKLINCECGRVVTGDTDEELIASVEEHINSDHPELVGKLSRDDILAMAEEA
jgi:predicted small metal-binding protein